VPSRCLATFSLVAAVLLVSPATLAAQAQETRRVRVFLDCSVCDPEFVRRELTFVDYVRERRDADVHVLSTTQQTAAGGVELRLEFIGLAGFAGVTDTLTYTAAPAESGDVTRRALLRRLTLGLMRYAAHSSSADALTIGYQPPAAAPAAAARDPWNHWVFQNSLDVYANGEQQNRLLIFNLSSNANRTTEAWKINFDVSGSYSSSTFELNNDVTFRSTSSGYGAGGLVGKSLTDHWSAGAQGSARTSSYLNQDLAIYLGPMVEYDVFPYAESSKRLLTVRYALGAQFFDYTQETIFGRQSELLAQHSLSSTIAYRQPWGSIAASLSGAQYLEDRSKYRLNTYFNVNLRVAKGTSLRFDGSVSSIRDQLSLPRESATDEEILVRQRQLATSYSYYVSIGVSYTFGSIYNTVVNPRFGGGF
jgi:hypothetical protein